MKKTILERVGMTIKHVRETFIADDEVRKSTQEGLGMIVGKGRSTISNYEAGEINMKLQDIANIFSVYSYDIVLFALPIIALKDVAKNKRLEKYTEWVTINRMLLDIDEEAVRKILQSFGHDINI